MRMFDKLKQYTLENGLRILLLPEEEHPLATFQVWYRVGSDLKMRILVVFLILLNICFSRVVKR